MQQGLQVRKSTEHTCIVVDAAVRSSAIATVFIYSVRAAATRQREGENKKQTEQQAHTHL